VLEVEQLDDERVARFGPPDRDGAGERVDRVEARVRELLRRGVGTDLPVERVPTLEVHDFAGFDGQCGVEGVVPDVVDVRVVVGQFVIDRFLVCRWHARWTLPR
jgi:hypothetical protein